MYLARASIRLLLAGLVATGAAGAALPQSAPGGPPAVGIVEATRRPITETSEFLGRIEAINRVNVIARVTGFLDKRLFVEGAEIKKGDLLYRLERGPFEADLASKQGMVAQLHLARAYAMQNDSVKARTAYQDFLAIWKDADPDIPILKEAKSEYAKLQ